MYGDIKKAGESNLKVINLDWLKIFIGVRIWGSDTLWDYWEWRVHEKNKKLF